MKQLPLYFEGQDVNRVEDKMNLQKIREVMLSIMSQLVPSLYRVDSYIELSDNQSLNKLLANIRTKSGNECLKSMKSWADIRILDKVVKVINTFCIGCQKLARNFSLCEYMKARGMSFEFILDVTGLTEDELKKILSCYCGGQ